MLRHQVSPQGLPGESVLAARSLCKPLRERARAEGLPDKLLASRFAAQLKPLLEARGISPDQECREARAKINAALSRFWGQTGRSANGAVALATTDTRFKDAVLIAKVDNLAGLLLRVRLWWSGKTSPGTPDYLQQTLAGRTLYLTYKEGVVIGASSLKRLREAAKSASAARSFPALLGQELPPRESVVVLANPNEELRDAVFRYGKTHAWTFDRGVSVITRTGRKYQIRARGYLHPLLVGTLYREACSLSFTGAGG